MIASSSTQYSFEVRWWTNPEATCLNHLLEAPGVIWNHAESSGIIWAASHDIWSHLETSGLIRKDLDSSWIIWRNLKSSVGIWNHQQAYGVLWIIRKHLQATAIIMRHLDSSGSMWSHLDSSVNYLEADGLIWKHWTQVQSPGIIQNHQEIFAAILKYSGSCEKTCNDLESSGGICSHMSFNGGVWNHSESSVMILHQWNHAESSGGIWCYL